jgi:hypothetical protein
LFRLRALPLLAWPIAQAMPWATLIGGCLAGLGYLAVMACFAGSQPLDYGSVRLTFVPAVAALAFVPRAPFRPLAQTVPVPAWVAQSGQLALAAPVLAVTCWAQLRIIAHAFPPPAVIHRPAVYPLIAQLIGWCAVTVAAAACVDRSRYADLGGAIAGPASFAVIALAWYAPLTSRFLVQPPAAAQSVTITWYAIATVAAAVTGAAMRDHWHRYPRSADLRGNRGLGWPGGIRLVRRPGEPLQ